MEDLTTQVISAVEAEEDPETAIPGIELLKTSETIVAEPDYDAIFIKVLITETDDIVLYESASLTMLKEDADALEKQKAEEEMAKQPAEPDKGSVEEIPKAEDDSEEKTTEIPMIVPIKRFSDAEAQTAPILYKTKAVNTDRIKKADQTSFVSNYDMWDTYADLEASTTEHTTEDGDKMSITTFKKDGTETIEQVLK